MDTIKAILHGTTKEEEKAKKEEKKAEQHGTSTTGEGSHLGHAINTSNTHNTNPLPRGVSSNAGGLGQNTMKSNYDSTPTDGPIATHGRHAEREATVGAGGVDVPHRPRDSEIPTGQTSGLSGVGNGSNVTGPNTQVHGINSATGTSSAGLASHNARDPLSSGTANPHHSDTVSGLGSTTSMPSGSTLGSHTGNAGTSDHHYGRDAAVAGGAAGLAHHEYGKHEHAGVGSNTNTGLGSNTTGTSSGHHLGRDAAAIGTAGALGESVHHHNQHGVGSGIGGVSGPHSTATGNRLDPNLHGGASTEDAHIHHGHQGTRHNVEGGGAEQADGFHGVTGTSADPRVISKGEFDSRHRLGGSTTAGPHSSNLANKADPRVDSDLSKTQGHHYGRDAAIAGGVGGATYEADKYLGSHNTHGSHTTNTNTTTAGPHSSNVANKADPRVDSDRSKEVHHYGRDAVVAGGAGGAAYEANKHLGHNQTTHDTAHSTTGATPLDQKPLGRDLGDKLHGTERNRGVVGETGFPHQHEGHHHGSTGTGNTVPTRDPAIGTGVPGAPRGNVQKHDHHRDNTSNAHHGHHDTTKAPEHLFTAPVINDEPTRLDGTHEIDPDTGASVAPHDHGNGHGHAHGDVKGKTPLERDINAAPLGNTETTPGSGLRDHHTSTTGSGLESGVHNTTSSGLGSGTHTSTGGLGDHHTSTTGSGLTSGTHNTTGSGLTSGTHTHGTHGLQSESERLSGNTGTTGSGLGNSGRVL